MVVSELCPSDSSAFIAATFFLYRLRRKFICRVALHPPSVKRSTQDLSRLFLKIEVSENFFIFWKIVWKIDIDQTILLI